MKVTAKGQVTIPVQIREKLGITPNSEVDFVEEGGGCTSKENSRPFYPPRPRQRRD